MQDWALDALGWGKTFRVGLLAHGKVLAGILVQLAS